MLRPMSLRNLPFLPLQSSPFRLWTERSMTLAPMRSRTNRLKPKMSPQASARLKSSFSLRTILRAVARKLTPFSSAPWKTWSCYAAS